MSDSISREDVWDMIAKLHSGYITIEQEQILERLAEMVEELPSTQPERKWIPCSNPPKHHKDVIVRGIEAIGNVTVHKVMQWDVDMWRPSDYAPSIMWKEWSEI